MNPTLNYYSIKIKLSNDEIISKSSVRAISIDYAWDEANNEEDTQTVSIVDDNGIYHLVTKSHIIQVVVEEIAYSEAVKNKVNHVDNIFKNKNVFKDLF